MIKKKKELVSEEIPGFQESIDSMPEESRIFVDKSMEITHYILRIMEQKGLKQKDLAAKMGKTEAEVSKWLSGMHNYTLRSISKIEAALGSVVVRIPEQPVIKNTKHLNAAVTVKRPLKTGRMTSPKRSK